MSEDGQSGEILLYASHLRKDFSLSRGLRKSSGAVRAIDDVSFYLKKNETLGVVGETGCGKTTLGRMIISTIKATEGDIYFDLQKEVMDRIVELESSLSALNSKENKNSKGEKERLERELKSLKEKYSLTRLRKNELKEYRKRLQPVFQDPYSSLDPRRTIYKSLADPMRILTNLSKEEIDRRINELIKKIGLNEDHLHRLPHEFSGGQRQRIGIARAISIFPKLLVMDEPTSALDVSIQAQILNMLKDMRKENGLSFIFISHHLSVIRAMSDRVAVMYLGKIVEMADTGELFKNILHPYTRALMSAIPVPDPKSKKDRIILEGEIPSPANPPKGCYFHPRCPEAMETCGWSPRDLMEPLTSLIESSKDYDLGNIPQISGIVADESANRMKIEFQAPLKRESFDLLQSIIESGRTQRKGIVFRAISSVKKEKGSNSVIISMKEQRTPKLKELKNGHHVSCLLYDDEESAADIEPQAVPE